MQSFNRQIESYLAGNGVEITPLLSAVASDPTIGYTGPARRRRATCCSPRPPAKEADAIARMKILSGIALGGLLLALLVTWLASRSITRPLRSLKDAGRGHGRHPAAQRPCGRSSTPRRARTW